jgi:hypothetical protein
MRKWFWIGWAVAVVTAAAAGGGLWWWEHQKELEAAALRAELAQAKTQADELRDAAQRDADTIRDLQEKLASLEKAMAAWTGGDGAANSSLASRLLKAVLSETFDGDASKHSGDWVRHFVAGIGGFIASDEGKEIVSVSTDLIADTIFEEYFGKAGLPLEVEEKARTILARNLRENVDAVLDLFRGGFDLKKAFATFEHFRKNPWDERIQSDLATVLDANQLDEWNQRITAAKQEDPARMLEGVFLMSSPELTPESRKLAAETFTEELRAARDARGQISFSDLFDLRRTIEEGTAAEQTAYDRTRERLSQQLDENQMKVVDQFIRQQERGNETGIRIVELLFGMNKPATP